MTFEYISKNLRIVPANEAQVSLQNIAFSYGYGVYENIRVSNGEIRYLDEHLDRLMVSCKYLEIESNFSIEDIKHACTELNSKYQGSTYNMKIILIGGKDQQLFILPLAPKFVDKKMYRDGVSVITTRYERFLPQAKSLNMLGSYVVYTKAQKVGAYDSLLVNSKGEIPEGSRTNFYAIKDKTIFTAPDEEVLAGVTRKHILDYAREQGFKIKFETPKLSELNIFDGFFISNTSSKLLPINKIDGREFDIPESLSTLASEFRKVY